MPHVTTATDREIIVQALLYSLRNASAGVFAQSRQRVEALWYEVRLDQFCRGETKHAPDFKPSNEDWRV